LLTFSFGFYAVRCSVRNTERRIDRGVVWVLGKWIGVCNEDNVWTAGQRDAADPCI
jgi:hypothetical protein